MVFNRTLEEHQVPARTGKGVAVRTGQYIRLTDLRGKQPIDVWAFNQHDPLEYLSCEHTKPAIERLVPAVGDAAYTNRRRPIVSVVEDHSPGQHDMQFAACDVTRYELLGARGYHANCQDNLHAALKEFGVRLDFTPQPWNLFTNFVINPDRTFTIRPPDTKPGDYIVLRAEMDAYVVVSACPQDLLPVCGGNPTDIRVEVGSASRPTCEKIRNGARHDPRPGRGVRLERDRPRGSPAAGGQARAVAPERDTPPGAPS
jgi:uncharacterized protein YcgI (DUF1989 family)